MKSEAGRIEYGGLANAILDPCYHQVWRQECGNSMKVVDLVPLSYHAVLRYRGQRSPGSVPRNVSSCCLRLECMRKANRAIMPSYHFVAQYIMFFLLVLHSVSTGADANGGSERLS